MKANQQSAPTSVITSHAYLSIDVTNNIQYNNTYIPSHWMFQPADELVTSNILDSFNEYDDVFKLTCNLLIFERSSVLLKTLEFRYDDNQYFDIIDRMVRKNYFLNNIRYMQIVKRMHL